MSKSRLTSAFSSDIQVRIVKLINQWKRLLWSLTTTEGCNEGQWHRKRLSSTAICKTPVSHSWCSLSLIDGMILLVLWIRALCAILHSKTVDLI